MIGIKLKTGLFFLIFAVILAALILPRIRPANQRIPFLPVTAENIDTVSLSANHIATPGQTEQIVNYLNGVGSYGQRCDPMDDTKPGPITAIRIFLKDQKQIVVYEDYDGRAKISDYHTAYLLSSSVIGGLLNPYNAYDE